jgi:hypothetical protein
VTSVVISLRVELGTSLDARAPRRFELEAAHFAAAKKQWEKKVPAGTWHWAA